MPQPTNQKIAGRAFLRPLYADTYFPDHVLDRGKEILLRLCERIEAERPTDLTALYALTHAATEEFNELETEFEKEEARSRPSRARRSPRTSGSSRRPTVSRTRTSRS